VTFQKFQKEGKTGEIILELEDAHAKNDRGLPALRNFGLSIRRGEILGIAGVAGNGQREMVEVITGLRDLDSGKISLEGVDLTGGSPSIFAEAGVGHIPEDRVGMGLFADLAVPHNAILKEYREPPIRKGARIIADAAVEFAQGLVTRGDVRLPNLNIKVQTLSGGNQQKLLVRREIEIASKLLVAVHPTRGLDVAASEDVRMALVDHRNQGNAVLLVSEDLDEIFLLSDRIAVIYDGRMVGEFEIEDAKREEIGLLMGGISPVQEENS
jgi:simple sugar transport system ATP-binding protein